MLAALLLVPHLILSNATGIPGQSGKQGATCNSCHTGGAAPTVSLTGPAALLPGASATYTVTISGGAGMYAGFNASASGGGTLMPGADSRTMNGELTHSAPLAFSMGTATFSFTYVAPMTAGAVMLYAAGNSVNMDNDDKGDRAATATLALTIGSGSMTAPAEQEPARMTHKTANDFSGGVVDGGCSAAGGLPALLAAVLLLARVRRRGA